MAFVPFNKSSRGQIRSWTAGGAESDGTGWNNILPFWPAGPGYQHFDRNGYVDAKASRDLTDSTALAGYSKLVVTHVFPWISIGYMLAASGGFRDTVMLGMCIDAYQAFEPRVRIVRDTGGGFSAEPGYEELGINSGLAVHTIPDPQAILSISTNGGAFELSPSFGIPTTTTNLFHQAIEQPVPMSYHRNNARNLIPDGIPLEINLGEKAQIEIKNGVTDGMFEFDCWVQGYLTT